MSRIFPFALCLALACSGTALASEESARELCGNLALRTLSGLCHTVLRILPLPSPTQEEEQGGVATVEVAAPETAPEVVEAATLVETTPTETAEPVQPLDLTLPPLPELVDQPLREAPGYLPPLFGGSRRLEALSLGGRLIASEDDTEFDFTLSGLLDQIEGAEISIEFRN